MTYWEVVHTEHINGFDITVSIVPEDSPPDWGFETEEDKLNTLKAVNNETLLWFIAKVTASKCDVELVQDYLGGCCYRTVEEFLKNDYRDMVHTILQEAQRKIAELQY